MGKILVAETAAPDTPSTGYMVLYPTTNAEWYSKDDAGMHFKPPYKHGADVASATTINLDNATGDLVDVTGTTTITGITLAEGKQCMVRFTGALTLTHGASLILPTSANILTVAGDTAIFRGYASGVVRCMFYQRLAGTSLSVSGNITLGTEVATTSGTSINFTGLPAGVKRITVNLISASVNATVQFLLQIGDSGGIETSGYTGMAVASDGVGVGGVQSAGAGYQLVGENVNASGTMSGSMILTLEDSSDNTWCCISILNDSSNSRVHWSAGHKALSATLDRLSLTTIAGTATFDAGSMNISYE